MSQFKALATLIAHVLYDPFESILEPPVPMKDYEDLAFLGMFMDLENMGKAQHNYQGTPLNYTVKTVREIQAIARKIHEMGDSILDEELSPLNFFDDQPNLREVNGEIYEVMNMLPPPQAGADDEERQAYNAQQIELANTNQRTLPRALRGVRICSICRTGLQYK
ncbi:hypothetical protein QE152_g25834 [Popillia japonica]|uniref:Uncharacterized protein n=1 Tax=Popillia japonica TaxID=7064 RepID=A0AAW1K0N8_POPJA